MNPEFRKQQPDPSSPQVQQDIHGTRHFMTRRNQVHVQALGRPWPAVVARCAQFLPTPHAADMGAYMVPVPIGALPVRRFVFGQMATGATRHFR